MPSPDDHDDPVPDLEAEIEALRAERDALAARVIDLATALDGALRHFVYEGHVQGRQSAQTGWVPARDVEKWRDVCYGKGQRRGQPGTAW